MIDYDMYVKTLQEISIDKSKLKEGIIDYASNSLKEAVDFDKFQEDYFKSINPKMKKPKSVDALCFLDGKWCLIEFKNGFVSYEEICGKIGNSVSTILFKDNLSPKEFKENSIFILVYNKNKAFKNKDGKLNEEKYLLEEEIVESHSFDEFSRNLTELSGKPIISFKLGTFQNVYFSKVKTMDKEIFNKYIEMKNVVAYKK